MDCFYAAVHMRDDPSLQGQPVVIGGSPEGRGVIAAASYEARRFGVRSAMPSSTALRRCRHLVFIRPDFQRYRAESEKIFEILRQFTPIVQPVSIDEGYLDVTDHLGEWATATELAKEIRRRVRAERRLTVSIGVGPNRLIAKIASDFDKPDGLTVVPPQRVQRFLDPLPVRRLPGVGPATEKRLVKVGIERIEQLRERPREELEARFGRWGSVLWGYARGDDERPVRLSRERKSVSKERTYGSDLAEIAEMEAELAKLADGVAAALHKKKLSGRTLTVKIRYEDFTTLTRSHTFRAPTCSAKTLLEAARGLLRNSEAGKRRVRLLGVGCSNLVPGNIEQLRLFETVG
jgi:DNA polymerase-4